MGLAGSQEKRGGIAQRVGHGVDFGAQSALAAPDRLVFAVFFWAPALCWCARTMVLSIMAYSLSASAARISNTFFTRHSRPSGKIACEALSDRRSVPAGPARECRRDTGKAPPRQKADCPWL